MLKRALGTLTLALLALAAAGCSSAPGHTAFRGTTVPTGWHNGTCSHDCPIPMHQIPSSSTTTTQTSEPASFEPVDFTAISAIKWWVLGCRQGECPAVATTSDGGDSWNIVEAPSAWGNPLSQPGQGTIDNAMHLRFADAKDGWAFGPGLYATHDGGQTWSQLDLGGAIEDLEPGLGKVYAVVTPGPYPSPCLDTSPQNPCPPRPQLWSSPITSNAWSMDPVPEGFTQEPLAVHGNDVYLQGTEGADGESALLISTDQGQRFSESPDFGYGYGCDISPVSDSAIWAFCPTGMLGGGLISTDGGGTFTGVDFQQSPPPNCSDIVGVSASIAIAASCATGAPLERTVNGGQTFTPVQSAPDASAQWSLIGFTNSLDGYAFGACGSPPTGCLWHTTDSGQDWSPVTIQ